MKPKRLEDLGRIRELCYQIVIMENSPFDGCQEESTLWVEKYQDLHNIEQLRFALGKVADLLQRIHEIAIGDDDHIDA